MADKKHSERAHAVISGSFAHTYMKCSGAVALKEQVGEQPTSVYAEEGTRAHELAERVLFDRLTAEETGEDPGTADELGSKYEKEEDEEILDGAYGYAEHVFNHALEGFITGKAWGIEDQFVLHEKFEMYGHVDFWAAYKDDRGCAVGVIGDFKYGRHYVAAEKNPQLAYYACAFQAEMKRQGVTLDYIRAFIYQPRDGMLEAYRETKFTAKQIESWTGKFLKIAENYYLKQKVSFKPGEHCRFCPGKPICKAFQESAQNATGLTFLKPEKFQFPKPETVSIEKLAQILQYRKQIEAFLKSCYSYAVSQYQKGTKIPGMKFVEGSSRSFWTPALAPKLGRILKKHGIEPWKEPALRGITELEREVKKKKLKIKLREKYTTLPPGKPALVPLEDPRQALKTLTDVFTEVEDE